MKTMISVDKKQITRVTDDKAAELYHDGGWNYTTKSVWKEQVRDVEKKEETPTGEKTSNKMSKAQKRHMRNSKK